MNFILSSCFLGCFPVREFWLVTSNLKALLRMAIHCQIRFSLLSFAEWFEDTFLRARLLIWTSDLPMFCKSLMAFIQTVSLKISHWLSWCLQISLLSSIPHVPSKNVASSFWGIKWAFYMTSPLASSRAVILGEGAGRKTKRSPWYICSLAKSWEYVKVGKKLKIQWSWLMNVRDILFEWFCRTTG